VAQHVLTLTSGLCWREQQLSAMCAPASAQSSTRKSSTRPSGMVRTSRAAPAPPTAPANPRRGPPPQVRQRSDEADAPRGGAATRRRSSERGEATSSGSRGGSSRRSWLGGWASSFSPSVAASDESASPRGGSAAGVAEAAAGPSSEPPRLGSLQRIPIVVCEAEEGYVSGSMSISCENSTNASYNSSAKSVMDEDSDIYARLRPAFAGPSGPATAARWAGAGRSGVSPSGAEEAWEDEATVEQLATLMKRAGERLGDSGWEPTRAASRLREVDRICVEIVRTEATSRAGSRRGSGRGSSSDVSNEASYNSAVGANSRSPVLQSVQQSTVRPRPSSTVPPRPFLSKIRGAVAVASNKLASSRPSGRPSAVSSYSVESESSLEAPDASASASADAPQRSKRSSWSSLPAEALAAAGACFSGRSSAKGLVALVPRTEAAAVEPAEGKAPAARSPSRGPSLTRNFTAKKEVSALDTITDFFQADVRAPPPPPTPAPHPGSHHPSPSLHLQRDTLSNNNSSSSTYTHVDVEAEVPAESLPPRAAQPPPPTSAVE